MSCTMMGRWLTVLFTLVGGVATCYCVGGFISSWCGIVDSVLSGRVLSNTFVKTHKLCWDACNAQPLCVSSNFESGSGQCDLNNATHYDLPGDLIAGPGWVYTYSQKQNSGCAVEKPIQPLATEQAEVKPGWPLGTYGLPMPTAGCPTHAGFTWETGYRFHDTEDYIPSNNWSDVLHLQGPYGRDDMRQNFCMKTVRRVSETDVGWPHGKYCVFKYGECPTGMSNGSIYWDDENNMNSNAVNGTVPSGEYDQNTLIHFCCMTAGNASRPIALPTDDPFYLFAFGSPLCQQVQGMSITQEWFRWDDEDTGNENYDRGNHPYAFDDGWGHKLHYCFYQVQSD